MLGANPANFACELMARVNYRIVRLALEESQSLLAAMLLEPRPTKEIEEQIKENRKALTSGFAPLKRGRPTITAPRPWDSEGMSRRTWYRRRQAEKREAGNGQ